MKQRLRPLLRTLETLFKWFHRTPPANGDVSDLTCNKNNLDRNKEPSRLRLSFRQLTAEISGGPVFVAVTVVSVTLLVLVSGTLLVLLIGPQWL